MKWLAWKREMRVAMGLIRSLEGLKRKALGSLRKTEFCLQLPFGQASTSSLSWVSRLSAHPSDFRSISPLGPMSRIFKTHLSLCIQYTHPMGSVSLEAITRNHRDTQVRTADIQSQEAPECPLSETTLQPNACL